MKNWKTKVSKRFYPNPSGFFFSFIFLFSIFGALYRSVPLSLVVEEEDL